MTAHLRQADPMASMPVATPDLEAALDEIAQAIVRQPRGPRRRLSAPRLRVAIVVTAITTVVACLGGYAVARLRFPGREAVASLILILYLVPPALLFIPLYRVLAELGATNSLAALFLSYPTFTVPFCTWLLIGFFKALPIELEEAALVDGATRLQALRRVLLPLAAPGIVAAAIFAFTLS